jgi:hypothetical protein
MKILLRFLSVLIALTTQHFANVAAVFLKRERERGENQETVSTSRNDVDAGTETLGNERHRIGKKPLVSCPVCLITYTAAAPTSVASFLPVRT